MSGYCDQCGNTQCICPTFEQLNALIEQNKKLEAEMIIMDKSFADRTDELYKSNAVAMEMDCKYWQEFNRHEVTKAKLDAAVKERDELKAEFTRVDVLVSIMKDKHNYALESVKMAYEALSFKMKITAELANPSENNGFCNAYVSYETADKIDKTLAKLKERHGL